jgi:hypothetical protein
MPCPIHYYLSNRLPCFQRRTVAVPRPPPAHIRCPPILSAPQAQSSAPPPAPATKLSRALRKPSGAISVALEFARPGDLGPGLTVRAKDSKERLQIAGSRGLSATVRKSAAAALLISADTGDDYTAEALAAFAQEQVRSGVPRSGLSPRAAAVADPIPRRLGTRRIAPTLATPTHAAHTTHGPAHLPPAAGA